MPVLVEAAYGAGMIQRAKAALSELCEKRDEVASSKSGKNTARAVCALDLVIRRHQQKRARGVDE